uniref:Leucine rich repeats and calponin homology domain containing 3 n=1 Tax=Canis lupus familiaris TaxID=9615 RepID=A0A8I3SC26_CANLF
MAAAGLVAVATAAECCGPVASGGGLSGVSCGPSAGTGPGPGPWSRSLDRALEEAAVTGVLSLSGRKLREFPRGAANHDLTDTTRAARFFLIDEDSKPMVSRAENAAITVRRQRQREDVSVNGVQS